MNQKMFVLNQDMKCVGVLDGSLPRGCPFFEDVHTESLEHAALTLEFKVPASHSLAETIESECFIVYPNMDNRFELFQVKEIVETNQDGQYVKYVYAENAAVSDLLGVPVRPVTLTSYTIEQAVSYVLTGSDWEVGEIYYDDVKDVVFDDYTNALEALHKVMDTFGCEIEWEVKFDGLKVVNKLVNVHKQRGEETKKVFTYGLDLVSVERTEDTKELYTALIGLSNGDGYGNYLSLRDYHGPVDDGYELVDDWLGSLDALQQFGRNGRHIFGIYRFDGLQNATELYQKTLEKLKEVSKPALTYKVDVVLLERLTGYEAHKVRLGDTIIVKDTTFNPELVLQARVIELKRSKNDPSGDSVTLGEFKKIIISPIQQIQQLQAKLIQNENKWTNGADTAAEALETANTALTTANTAQTTAVQAQQTADTAQDTATQAQSTADQAQTTADQAQTTATQAQDTANTAQTTATNAQTTANQVKSTVDYWKHPSDTTTIDGGKIYTGSISAYQIAAGAITADKIAAGSIDTTKISASGITANTIKGGTLTLGGSGNGYGKLVVLRDNETPVAQLDASSGGFDTLNVGTLYSPSVVPRNASDYTIYVDPSSGSASNSGLNGWSDALPTLQAAFDIIPKYNEGTITILVSSTAGTWTEGEIYLKGVCGCGQITIDFNTPSNRSNTLIGRLFVFNSTNYVLIQNGTIKNQEVFASNYYYGCVYALQCSRVHVKNMYLDARTGSKLAYCVVSTYNSYVRVEDCEAYNGATAQLISAFGSHIETYNTGCKGSGGTYGVYVVSATAGGTGNGPLGSTANLKTDMGGICNATYDFNYTITPPGAPPTQTYTYTWTATSTKSYRTTYGWRTDNSNVYQGDYGYGNHTGVAFFNYSDIQSKLSGKTIKSASLYMERIAGGTNSTQYINLYTHNYASQPGGAPTISLVKSNAAGWAVGDKKWVSIPTSVGTALRDGTAKGIAIYASSGSPYMIFNTNVKLEIVAEG